MRRTALRILGMILVASFVVGVGVVIAQDKPAQEKEKTETVAAADPLSGDWDGTVDTPNGTLTFGLKLKLDKDKVSGEISSEQGSTPITGTWTEGKLSASFDYNGTPITMTGGIKEEALAGEMSYGGGQAIMPFTAKKHK